MYMYMYMYMSWVRVPPEAALHPYTCTCTYTCVHLILTYAIVYIQYTCCGFESHLRQLIFPWKSDCLGCVVLLCLVVCLTLLASFLHLPLMHMHVQCNLYAVTYPTIFSVFTCLKIYHALWDAGKVLQRHKY